ncbi:hypothetical protein C0580_01090, partial [Candidatus Parcubacteria bacterium]
RTKSYKKIKPPKGGFMDVANCMCMDRCHILDKYRAYKNILIIISFIITYSDISTSQKLCYNIKCLIKIYENN